MVVCGSVLGKPRNGECIAAYVLQAQECRFPRRRREGPRTLAKAAKAAKPRRTEGIDDSAVRDAPVPTMRGMVSDPVIRP
jgi:hypothetical protein